MERLENYRNIILKVLEEYNNSYIKKDDIERFIIIDDINKNYFFFRMGWNGDNRIYGCSIHFRIRDNKIWIEYDGTEEEFALKLEDEGVPKEDIVLSFHHPEKRKFTGFAVE